MNAEKLKRTLIVFGVPVLVLILVTVFFGFDNWGNLYAVMSVSFLFFLPFIAGGLTVYLSKLERVNSIAYRILAPWITVLIFFALTVSISLEGWACWIMMLPFFLVISSMGGLYSGYIKATRKKKFEQINISLLVLLPFLVGPVEKKLATIPGKYEAFTSIDIKASPEKIWGNVTSVKEIKPEEDTGWLTRFLGMPRPVEAELNFEGVGAAREAIFSGGLVFHEKVRTYQHQKQMNFSITALPYEIPSTTMDEHVVIGGDYFDVLDGTYELEKLNDTTWRLKLYSHFRLTTNFNFYASWWAGWIMKDIQNNILNIIKERSEQQ